MMITLSLPFYLLLVANAALIVAAAFAVMRVERALRDATEFWSSPNGLSMQSLEDSAHRRRLMLELGALKRVVEELTQRPEPAMPERVVDLSFGRAVRLAKRGASVDELTQDCGLSRGEAELLHRLHCSQDREQAAQRA